MNKIMLATAFGVAMLSGPAMANSDLRFPYCAYDDSDSDGDGYGWENEMTCLVAESPGSYTVTIRNLTYQQVLSPAIVVAHSSDIALYRAGDAASHEVVAIAESGNAAPLADSLAGNTLVSGVAISDGPVPPAHVATVTVDANEGDVISVLTMLVNTNDAFAAIDGVELPAQSGDYYVYGALTYDAGSERNDELCAHIPGPACGGAGPSDDDAGEGFVHVHRGLHGGGDLSVADYAWRDPAAKITITRN